MKSCKLVVGDSRPRPAHWNEPDNIEIPAPESSKSDLLEVMLLFCDSLDRDAEASHPGDFVFVTLDCGRVMPAILVQRAANGWIVEVHPDDERCAYDICRATSLADRSPDTDT